MLSVVGEFKKLTGYKLTDIARAFKLSKQHTSASLKNRSLTYQTSVAYMIKHMVDLKINILKEQIHELEHLKGEIDTEVMRIVGEREGGENNAN